ncbi:MAG: MBL fold metallo-hydrolase [Desulfobulbaceae bacterium]|nr:MBL fold metallo-hydrolase [Desulfobulbaceae bacterium]HIJ89838.1 MBL fold metallo-hydrolase [Deltaproteobacteria bacterium]
MQQARQYDRPIKIAEGIFWVGFFDQESNLHCNPYLICANKQAVLIDGGSRPDFAVVMTKILQTGLDPKSISHLLYQHYDPDLCGSIPHFIDACENPALSVLSHPANNIFIRYYTGPEHHHHIASIKKNDNTLVLGDRRLRFLETPYCHSTGSFVTYDEQTKTLFTSDLFGSFSTKWDLHLELTDKCFDCRDFTHCPHGRSYCAMADIIAFHRYVMPSSKALANAMRTIKTLDIALIAPQHGSLVTNPTHIYRLIELLEGLDNVGIDQIC